MIQAVVKEEQLRKQIQRLGRVIIAFSGGVDSAYLLRIAATELGDQCFAITCVAPTMASREVEASAKLAKTIGLSDRHFMIESNELNRPGFAQNPKHRCALCKTELMEVAKPVMKKLAIPHILLGTNSDDLGDFRPGIAAASKLGAQSPMVDVGLTKGEIRRLSKNLGLPTWNKPQMACLSSRFPYGTTITQERLKRVDEFENSLRDLGFRQLRVRFHDTIARVEIAEDELDRAFEKKNRDKILSIGKNLGFTYVTLDLGGFRSGSLNETPLITLNRNKKRIAS